MYAKCVAMQPGHLVLQGAIGDPWVGIVNCDTTDDGKQPQLQHANLAA